MSPATTSCNGNPEIDDSFTLRKSGLQGKVAIIASRNSGKCIPSELAQILVLEGCKPYIAEAKEKVLEIILKEVENYTSTRIMGKAFDFFEPGNIERFVEFVKEKEGRVDILVTDLGLLDFVYNLKPFLEQQRRNWQLQIQDIFEAAMLWCRGVIPVMMESKSGRIIHVVSDAASVGVPKMSVYGACKAAVCAFSRSLAHELAPYKITVNCVSLGLQEIDEIKDPSEEAVIKLDKSLKFVPLRRYGEPEEIAAMVAYLASDLGAYITGQTIHVSGGLVMT